MLYLIGIGLSKGDISMSAVAATEKCSSIYLEQYTSIYEASPRELELLFGKSINLLSREQTESMEFLEEAKTKKLALLVIGDPLSATTHFEIISECKKRDITYEIIHSVSVLTAVAETGLSLYKFGKVTSIPKPQENFKPTSFVNILKQNQSIDAHTLFILEPELKLSDAIDILLKATSIVTSDTFAIGCARLGREDAKIAYNNLEELRKIDFGSTPHCLIIPAKLDFKEEEFINEF